MLTAGAQIKTNETVTTYHKIQVEDCNVFYREAGAKDKPAVLLLHGFPSSSHMFRELMPELADEYHLIAPDFPSFGQTESPTASILPTPSTIWHGLSTSSPSPSG